MKILLLLLFGLLPPHLSADSVGREFLEGLCSERPLFQRHVGDRNAAEWDAKNPVASWITNYIDLLSIDHSIDILFDPEVPDDDKLGDYRTVSKQPIGEIVFVRVSNVDDEEIFEDAFFNMLSALLKARDDAVVIDLKNRFFAGNPIGKREIVLELSKLNHQVLFEIGKLRGKVFAPWGKSEGVFSVDSLWDKVEELNYERWRANPKNGKVLHLITKQAEQSYASWALALEREKASRQGNEHRPTNKE